MARSPAEWLSRYRDSQAYASCWRTFEKFLEGKGLSWQSLLTKDAGEICDVIDQHLLEITPDRTSSSLRFANACIRSFFRSNRIIGLRDIPPNVPLGGRAANISRLTSQIIREMVIASKPKARSFLLFKFQSLQDNNRMLWISRNAWPQIKPQLQKGGWTDRMGKLWPDVVKIDVTIGRKRNFKPYFCFVGKEAIDALKKYIEERGEPKPGELIWQDLSTIDSITRLVLRLSRRIGVVPQTVGENSGVRYGFNIHEFRDVAQSLWHESGADQKVAEFCMGHTIDPLNYDKVNTLSRDFAVKHFLQAYPYLALIDTERVTVEKTKDLESQAAKQAEAIKQLEERLNQATMEWKNLNRYTVGYIITIALDRLAQKENLSPKESSEWTKIATAPWSLEYDKIRDKLEPEIERAKIDARRAEEAGPEGIDRLFSDMDPIKKIMRGIFALYPDWDRYFELLYRRKRLKEKPSKSVA